MAELEGKVGADTTQNDPLAVFNQMLAARQSSDAPVQPQQAPSDPMAVFQAMMQAKSNGADPTAIPGAPQVGAQPAQEAPAAQGVLSNAPTDTLVDSLTKGAGTAGIKGLAGIAGGIGDIASLRDVLGARLYAAITGGTTKDALTGLAEWRQKHPILSAIADPVSTQPTSAEAAAPFLAQTGEYQPQNPVGKAAMAGAEMAIPMALTGGASGAGALKLAGLGAASGAIANAGQQLGHPWLGLAAGLAVPEAASRLAGLTRAGQAAAADKALVGLATNPEGAAAAAAPTELVAGSAPTLAEQTLDPGIIQAQKIAETTTRGVPGGFAEQLAAKQAAQNTARTAALEDLAPPSAVQTAPAQLFRDRLSAINAENEASIAAAQKTAEAHASAIPDAVPAEASGAQLRGVLANAYAAARDKVRAAYNAVDPNGTLNIVASPVKDAAVQAVNNMGQFSAPMAGEEAAIFKAASELPAVAKFRDLQDLEQRITAAVAAEKRAVGAATPATARLGQLKTAISDAMSNAIDNQGAYEQSAVASGKMAAQDTMEARLQAEANAFRSGTAPLPSELTPNMAPENAQAYAGAKTAHGEMAQTFRAGPVGKAMSSAGYEGQFKMPESGLPSTALPGGDKGYEATSSFLNAANQHPLAVGALKDMATSRLRDMMKGAATLDPAALAAWKGKYGSSLRAIDEVSPGFSSSFDTAAGATQKLKEAQSQANAAISEAKQGAAAQLLGAHSTDEVRNVVGGLLADKFGPSKIKDLLTKTGADAEAVKGLRAAGVDWMVNKFTNAGVMAGKNVVSGAKLGKFVNENSDSIRTLYGADGLRNMQALAADLKRSEEVFSAMKVKGGSDTASNFMTWLNKAKEHVPNQVINMAMIFDAFQRFGSGHWGALALDVGLYGLKSFFGNLRIRGIQNMTDMVHEGLLDPEIGKAMLQRGLDASGKLDMQSANRILRLLLTAQTPHRASGGRVGADHEAIADRLIRSAEKARKMIGETTEPLLGVPDRHIVKALSIANRGI